MKKIIVAIFFSLAFANPASAQMKYAVIGGLNFGYFNEVPPLLDAFSSLGYMIGVQGSVGANIFFEPAVEYASYGSTILMDDASRHTMRTNYIRVPLQAGVKVFEDAPVNIEVRAGLSESFLTGFTDQSSGPSPAFVKSNINKWRTGAVIGGGVRILFLKLDLEYEWGITDFFSNGVGPSFRVFSIILGGNF